SAEVLPQIKEYERVWTTVVNAYVGPALASYLERLAARLTSHGYRGDVLIMQSHGGVAPVRESTRLGGGGGVVGGAGGGRGVGAAGGGRRAVGAGGRRRGRTLQRAAPGRGEPDHVRHGRHVDR